MRFRFKAFSLHLLGSASALTLTLGLLYLGWYHWPGWYLADLPTVLAIMIGVDVVLGPLLTFIVAPPAKPRGVLARDVGVILLVQLVAFGYGVTTLWHGRPLSYAFSVNCLSVVQAQDIERTLADSARRIHHSRPTGTACRAGYGRRCRTTTTRPTTSSDRPSREGWTSRLGPPTTSLGRAGPRSCAARLKRVDEIKFFSKKGADC